VNIILISLVCLCMSSCASHAKLRPTYPPMKDVVIEEDGSMNPQNVDKAVDNSLSLQEYIDIIY